MQLVTVQGNKVFCDSSMVAKKFGVKHNDVTRMINRLVERLRGANVTPKVSAIEKEYRGQKFTAYLMDREFFTLLGMRFESKKAIEWQVKFNDAFYVMEQSLSEISKPSSVMEDINKHVKICESEKEIASEFGRGLAAYKKAKKENAHKLKLLLDDVQLQLGFEG